jgi:hypothetical protein
VALLAACGGGNDTTFTQQTTTQRRSTGPAISRVVADRLAARSDRIAVRLDRGDGCGAASEATRLRDDLTEAINTQAIPAAYLEDLSGAVNELQAQIPRCEPPPRRGKDKDDNGRGKHKGKDKKGEDD